MKAPKATVRLAAVVKACGKPQAVTLWVSPRQNPQFQSALQSNRVVTIKQGTTGTRKDFGVVGFHQEPNVSYWVFPKPLAQFEGKRIIGIDYSALQEPSAPPGDTPANRARPALAGRKAKVPPSTIPKPAAKRPRRDPPPKPAAVPRFRVTVRCISFVEIPQVVTAATKRDARDQALAALAGQRIDFSRGTQSRTAIRVERLRTGEQESAVNVFRRLRALPERPGAEGEG